MFYLNSYSDCMSGGKEGKGKVVTEVDDWGRKKFTLAQSDSEEEPAKEQELVEVGRNRAMLLGREQKLNIEKYIGRVEKNKKSKTKEVFFCEVCQEGFKCDIAYITHVNSPAHNRKLGMSMKVKATSLQEVQDKLRSLKGLPPTKVEADRAKEQDNEAKIEEKEEKGGEGQEQQESGSESSSSDLEAMLKAYNLPSSFGSKKQKR